MVRKNIGWLFWFVAALFYAYEMLHRVAPNVLTPFLRIDLNIDEHQLGLLAAMYFYAYAIFQLPAGILIDKYDTKKILVLSSVIVAIGSFIFTTSTDINLIYISRFMVGTGSAFAFISCLHISRQWLSTGSFPLVVGLTNLFGTLGALSGGQPLAAMVTRDGWREAFYQITLMGIFISVLILLVLPKSNQTENEPQELENTSLFAGLIYIIRKPTAWLIALYGALVVAPIVAFPEAWGVDYLKAVYNIDDVRASSMTQCIFIGTAIGGPLMGWLVTKTKPINLMRLASLLALALLYMFVYIKMDSYLSIYLVFFFFGIFSANMLICFHFINNISPKWAQGAAIGFTNMIIMIVGGVVQQFIGALRNGLTHHRDGIPQLIDYQIALSILPISLCIAISLTLFMKPLHK